MIPVPETTELRQLPLGFLPFDVTPSGREPRAARSTVAGFASPMNSADELGIGALLRFKSLMAVEGQVVHLARLCYDKLYAYERIAAAHACSDENLRRLALELFQIYHRREFSGREANA